MALSTHASEWEVRKMANYVDPSSYSGAFKKEQLSFVQQNASLHDSKFETKPISYLRGCWNRFKKNKGAIVAGIILLMIVAFAIIAPATSSRSTSWYDPQYASVLPKIKGASGFWDGTKKDTISESDFYFQNYYDSEKSPIAEVIEKTTTRNRVMRRDITTYTVRIDTYAIGAKEIKVDPEEFERIVKWEEQTGRTIRLGMVSYQDYVNQYFADLIASDPETYNETNTQQWKNTMNNRYAQNSNIFYKIEQASDGTKLISSLKPVIVDDNIVDLYERDTNGNIITEKTSGGQYVLRADYNVYYEFLYGEECYYVFGANSQGYDIFVRLASGARLSLILGVSVSAINLIIGLIWGSITGYYGGTVDLVMERITDILSSIPFVILATLFQLHLKDKVGPIISLLFAFVVTGWIGVASTTRMQFYRFKNQEYVLASRTLGAKDLRLIFVDILPNALGTLVTSTVLMIPSVIFSESSLSYLNIVNLQTSNITSVGTLLNEGSTFLSSYPHMIMFPALFISLLMISFNLIGNGLRDAFNPTLRGSE